MRASSILILGLCGLPYSKSQADADSFNFGWVTTIPTTTGVYYAPNPGYDSYWVGGEWVFGPTRASTTSHTVERLRVVNADRVLVCGRPCARIYRKLIGEVCVHKLDNVYDPQYNGKWRNARPTGFIDWRLGGVLDRNFDYMRTFPSYCYFLDLQCRTNIFHGIGYVFLHMGACLRDADAFPNLMVAQAIKDRKAQFINTYNDQRSLGVNAYSKSHTDDSVNIGLSTVTTIETTASLESIGDSPALRKVGNKRRRAEPDSFYWIAGQWLTSTTPASTASVIYPIPWFTQPPVTQQPRACSERRCPKVYARLVGEVCVHKLDNVYDPQYNGNWRTARPTGFIDWRLGGVLDRNFDYMRTFPSYCYFLDLQCRTKLFDGTGYAFLHMGACLRDADVFPNLMNAQAIKDRKQAALLTLPPVPANSGPYFTNLTTVT